MCTVSLVAHPPHAGRGVRLVANRDERRTRPDSSAPVLVRLGDISALMPIDAQAGGTWVGVADTGIAAALLNANPRAGLPPGPRSRGELIPRLLTALSLDDAAVALAALGLRDFGPFTLLLTDAVRSVTARWLGDKLTIDDPQTLDRPVLLTSSSLGDALVAGPRAALFDDLLARQPDALAAQQQLHDHQWPDEPHLSVRMARLDARTVSRTVIDLLPGSAAPLASMTFERLADAGSTHGIDGPHHYAELPLRRPALQAEP